MAKKTAMYGLLLAFGMILSYIEALLPLDFIAYGVKLGLANLICVYLLYRKNIRTAFAVNLLRILLVALLFGNVMTLLYSICGGVLSLLVMIACKVTHVFSPVGVSVAGGVAHNIGQLLTAAVLLGSKAVLYYLPVLLIAGVVCGLLVGIVSAWMIARIDIAL